MQFLDANLRLPRERMRGQSMIELLVATTIVVVSLLGVLVLVNRSLGINRVATEQYIATYLAAEGIELTKNFFDRSYLLATPDSTDFYGWIGPGALAEGVYRVDFNDFTGLTPVLGCAISVPDEPAIRTALFGCTSSVDNPLRFDAATGLYSYDIGAASKFHRLIVVDNPYDEFGISESENVDWRVTSAVGWESRGGEFFIQLQDHFLPWRIP